jgi:hypothetical protein
MEPRRLWALGRHNSAKREKGQIQTQQSRTPLP